MKPRIHFLLLTPALAGVMLLGSWGHGYEGITESPAPVAKADTSVSLLFIGDIMGHGPQISSAYNDSSGTYSYDEVFSFVKAGISSADFAIANLEVTLAGPPYTGYPQFSSPDALAQACLNAGIDVLATANNHSCDRGGKGLLRTIKVLDSLGIKRTGTFADSTDRFYHNPLTLEKNGICIGLLNYTYGTNGIPFPFPTLVNLLDTAQIDLDLDFAKKLGYDILIAFVHFGTEYELTPNARQESMVSFLFSRGVDVVIGSHPHVIQKMLFLPATDSTNTRFVTYSLGNYVSNQRDPGTDGGAMVRLQLTRVDGKVQVSESGYLLTWVYRRKEEGKTRYNILPCSVFETQPAFFSDTADFMSMQRFIETSRQRLKEGNLGVYEYKYANGRWLLGTE